MNANSTPAPARAFATTRAMLSGRWDANYFGAAQAMEDRYAHAHYPVRRLDAGLLLAQYGCSDPANSDGRGLPIIRMNNLQNDVLALEDLKHVPLGLRAARRYRLRRGDLLLNRTNSKELVGKCAVFDEPGVWTFASYLIRLRFDTDVLLPEFVAAFLNGPAGRLQIDRISRQIIGMTNINSEELKALLIPYPDVPTQRQLVERLSEARATRDDARRRAEDLLSLDSFVFDLLGLKPGRPARNRAFAVRTDTMRSQGHLDVHYFHPERMEAIGLLTRETAQYETVALNDVVTSIRSQTPTPENPYLGLADVQSNTGELVGGSSQLVVVGNSLRFEANDVLFGRLRPYLNKVFRAESAGTCSPEFFVLRSKDTTRLLPEYLGVILRSQLVLAQTRHMMTGNTHPRLAPDDLADLRVPVPNLAVQHAIAEESVRRRGEARLLRDQGEEGWSVAKSEFEENLLGPA